jgi:hypothetical protein
MRRYDICYLDQNDQIVDRTLHAPALPAFEDAFSALGHGALLQTRNGPMAVEDLLPGDLIRLADGSYDTLLWRGSITIKPEVNSTQANPLMLTRITADALGMHRPAPDLVLGPSARLLHKAGGIQRLTGKSSAYVPVSDFRDGNQFIALQPAAPVNVYQLGFACQQGMLVNGVEIESLHPGTVFALGLRGELLAQYMALFPHKHCFDDFGEMRHPRLRLRDLDLLT